jgi:hypothetical protein
MKRVFILGCERSGSTWLSNIFDSHPHVEFFMEPFADYTAIFPGIPGRNIYLSHPDEKQINAVKTGYRHLFSLKYPLFYKRGRPLYFKRVDRFFIHWLQKLLRVLKTRLPLRIQRYNLLDLHISQIPVLQQTRKNKNPSSTVEVTKELRLNFKIGFISRVFPGALYFIVLRSPGAQISSIERLFQKGSLGELRQSLQTFFEDIINISRFAKYRKLIDYIDCSGSGHMDIKLIVWWLINYDVLLEDLEHHGCKFQMVCHEEISETPYEVVSQIFDFMGLDVVREVQTYLEKSTSASHHQVRSNLDTLRDSANFYKQAIKAVNPVLNQKIRETLQYFHHSGNINSHLVKYLEKLDIL